MWIAIINLGTDLLLIRWIGLYAASVSTLIAYGIMMIYRCFDVQKYVRIKISSVKIIKTVILSGLVFGAYYSRMSVLQIIAFIITILYAIVENRVFLKTGWSSVKQRMNWLKRGDKI